MRKEQQERINTLAEKVMDVFITEADPENWTGADVAAAEMTPAIRGARNWDMKNANQAGALAMRVLELRDRVAGIVGQTGEEDDRAEADISKYEKQARTLLDAVGKRA